jgi:hypothetical protein
MAYLNLETGESSQVSELSEDPRLRAKVKSRITRTRALLELGSPHNLHSWPHSCLTTFHILARLSVHLGLTCNLTLDDL